jgi:hypothetical protein
MAAQPNDPLIRPVATTVTTKDDREIHLCCGCNQLFYEKLLACSKCLSAHYCSKQCQRTDWQVHKPHCISRHKTDGYIKFRKAIAAHTGTGLFISGRLPSMLSFRDKQGRGGFIVAASDRDDQKARKKKEKERITIDLALFSVQDLLARFYFGDGGCLSWYSESELIAKQQECTKRGSCDGHRTLATRRCVYAWILQQVQNSHKFFELKHCLLFILYNEPVDVSAGMAVLFAAQK